MQLDVISWFLLTLFIGVFAEKRLVNQDSLVCLFQNVTADNADKDVGLYVSGVENPTRIVTFTFVNGHISMEWDPHMADTYSRLFMDAKRNIWIAYIDETYERKFEIFSSKILGEVELTILKTNYTALKENTQKGNALPETSYSTTKRTPQKDNTEKGDDLSDTSSLMGYLQAIIVLICILILMVVIMMTDHILAWIQCKKSNSVPQPVQVTSHRDSPDSTSYQLIWDKPDDGGFPLIKYIIRYCEVEIIPDKTEYELSKYLKPLEYVDNILPSAVRYKLSPLTPGRYYLVEIQAIHTQGQTLKSFIFKTKEGVPQPVQVTSHHDSPDSTSYKLMWDKPDDGGSPLIKYIIRYHEMKISPNGIEYEWSKPLYQLEITRGPSDESCTLSSLNPGSFYQVEVQAVNTMGMSSKMFIFKTKENKTYPKLHKLSKNIENLPPRNNDTVFTDNDEQNLKTKSKKSTERKMENHDSEIDSNDEKSPFLKDPVDKKI